MTWYDSDVCQCSINVSIIRSDESKAASYHALGIIKDFGYHLTISVVMATWQKFFLFFSMLCKTCNVGAGNAHHEFLVQMKSSS